jgi:hypothetical protein
MITINNTDFYGKFELTIGEFTGQKLTDYINRYQNEFTIELLGVELYDLYLANSTDPEFVIIEDPLIFQSNCGKIYKSQGMKDMLKGFIFFMYGRDLPTQQTVTGAVKQSSENSMHPSNVNALLWQRYNESVTSYEAIQAYIRENSDVYPTFRGMKNESIIPYF